MAKMSFEQKLAAVERYLTSRESSRAVAAEFGISHCYLLTLTNQYKKNGVEAFVRRYTNYTKAFKLDVLNYMTEHGTSLYETAAIFNIGASSCIRNWQKQFETVGEDALQPKKKGRQSMKKRNETIKKSTNRRLYRSASSTYRAA